MKVLVTPEAHDLIYSHDADGSVLRLVGEAIKFEIQARYRRHLAMSRLHPNVKPLSYIRNGTLGLRHYIAEQQVLLFCPPPGKYDLTSAYFEEQLASSSELQLV